jgi:cardiolipin synthase
MMLIDDAWAFIGSANWDARSLRLNFEFNIECYSRDLAAELGALFDRKRAASTELTLAGAARRTPPAKLRDGLVRLLAPYL